jgi:hypothetical protein
LLYLQMLPFFFLIVPPTLLSRYGSCSWTKHFESPMRATMVSADLAVFADSLDLVDMMENESVEGKRKGCRIFPKEQLDLAHMERTILPWDRGCILCMSRTISQPVNSSPGGHVGERGLLESTVKGSQSTLETP